MSLEVGVAENHLLKGDPPQSWPHSSVVDCRQRADVEVNGHTDLRAGGKAQSVGHAHKGISA